MERRTFTRESKLKTLKLVQERGVTGGRPRQIWPCTPPVLRCWGREYAADNQQAFPCQRQMKTDQLELEHIRHEVSRLKAEEDIVKKPRPTSRRSRCHVQVHGEAPRELADRVVVRDARCLAGGFSRG